MKIRNLSFGIIGLIFLTSCTGNKEIEFPLDIKVEVVENQETTVEIPINVTIKPLYRKNIKFKGILPHTQYIFTNRQVNIRKSPSTKSSKINTTQPLLKMELISIVNGDNIGGNSKWYEIKKNNKIGYIHSSVGVKREFRFEEMVNKAIKLEEFIEESNENNESLERIISYIPGSSERKGAPRDKYGNRGEQSIVGRYTNEDGKNSFRYLQDGRIISVDRNKENKTNQDIVKIPDSDNFYKINKKRTEEIFETEKDSANKEVIGIDGVTEYKIINQEGSKEPKQETEKTQKIEAKEINKMIVIDIKNQTQGAFEKNKDDDVWELISYTTVTTGKDNKRTAYDTPSGYYLVQNTVKQVIFPYKSTVKKNIYNNDGEVVGEKVDVIKKYSRANYGIRFSGGGYLHGIPLNDDIVKSLGSTKKVVARKKYNERRLGTYKASHKCVRSPDDYEKFLYEEFVGYDEKYKNKWWRKPKELVAIIIY